MTMHIQPYNKLEETVVSSNLFGDWIEGELDADFIRPEHRQAQLELATVFQGEKRLFPAFLFTSAWVEEWAGSHEVDLPTDNDRSVFRDQVAALQNADADIVVTGQQPGFLGGPLYTLYKIATTIELARSRTRAGLPTYPVFWSGDDDDDLREALQPVAVRSEGAGLVRAPAVQRVPGGRKFPMLGRRAGDPAVVLGAELLQEGAGTGSDILSRDLAAIWQEGAASGWTWARLARRSVLRVFQGTGLMVISGDDSRLHAEAETFYESIVQHLDSLSAAAQKRGRKLAAGRWHAQISERSLKRPLFRVDGDQRLPWDPGTPLPAAADLRPGVMLRSAVQDWLLDPAAVVVGPSELAYLRQLDSLYEELGLARPPLVPRLFAWLLPEGMDPADMDHLQQPPEAGHQLAANLAEKAQSEAGKILARILAEDLKLPEKRALELAKGRTRRWRKGVEAMLRDEIERVRADTPPPGPDWILPGGKRQERSLAYLGAVARWGSPLVQACLQAAHQHLELGAQGRWREFVIEVPAPSES